MFLTYIQDEKNAAATLKKIQNGFNFAAVLHPQIWFKFVLNLETAIHTRAAIRSVIYNCISYIFGERFCKMNRK